MIAPTTSVFVLSGVPLDTTYKDTLTFSSTAAQSSFFVGRRKYSFTDFTYQRINSSIRVPQKADNLYDCNYIMYQNTSYGSKWFYAFITAINYINDEMTELIFELDAMQTWYFDYQVMPSFVQREHVNNDSIGANTVPENVETGPYVTTSENNLIMDYLNIYILATEKNDKSYWENPGVIGGFPVPCFWALLGTINDFSVGFLNQILSDYAEDGKLNAIIGVFTAPHNFIGTGSTIRNQSIIGPSKSIGFVPRNNKLYTYPYCTLALIGGSTATELRYENFNTDPPTFQVKSGFGVNMEVICYPVFYEGVEDAIQYSVSFSGFPLCPWIGDYFQNWAAQNKATLQMGLVKSSIQVGAGGAALLFGNSGGVGGITTGVENIANILASAYQHSIVPDQMYGSANAPDIKAIANLTGLRVQCRAIKPEYGRIIDDYFSMYGYQVNRVKVPNITGRASWNFVKTQNAMLVGSVPLDSMAKLRQIYNAGITFWHGDYVGDYTRSNNVV